MCRRSPMQRNDTRKSDALNVHILSHCSSPLIKSLRAYFCVVLCLVFLSFARHRRMLLLTLADFPILRYLLDAHLNPPSPTSRPLFPAAAAAAALQLQGCPITPANRESRCQRELLYASHTIFRPLFPRVRADHQIPWRS